MTVESILVEFDNDTRVPGASGANRHWRELPVRRVMELGRQWGWYAGAAVELAVSAVVASGKVPLLLGGGHSLSYFAVKEVVKKHGFLNLLHFDAHHDRYDEPRLCHYSVMSRIQADLPVAIVTVGARFENQDALEIARVPRVGSPWYISLDVDFFDPSLVHNVVHAVPVAPPDGTLSKLKATVEDLIGDDEIAGLDAVEWVGWNVEKGDEKDLINSAVKYLIDRCGEQN